MEYVRIFTDIILSSKIGEDIRKQIYHNLDTEMIFNQVFD